jgi:hypothetical protein
MRFLLDLIFIALFNVFFFLLGDVGNFTAAVWISYGFIHFAYIMLLITSRLAGKGKNAAALGFPIYTISTGFFLVTLVVGSIFIFNASEDFTVPLLVLLTITAIYGIVIILNMMANKATTQAVEKQEQGVAYIKNAAMQIELIMNKVSDEEPKEKLRMLHSLLRASPVKSYAELKKIELEIIGYANELESFVSMDNKEAILSTTEKMTNALKERNLKMKGMN